MNLFLNEEQYTLLEDCVSSEVVAGSSNVGQLQYLESKGLIESFRFNSSFELEGSAYVSSHTVPCDPVYRATEYGKGFLAAYEGSVSFENSVKNMASSAKQSAEAASEQSEIARKDSRSSSIRSWVAIALSVIAIIVQVLSHLGIIHALPQ